MPLRAIQFLMEVIGLLASAAQISVYACNIVSIIGDIRAAVHKAPSLLRDRSQQLEILSAAVENIRLNHTLHNDVLATYLSAVQDKILIVKHAVRLRSQEATVSSIRKLRAALTFVARKKELESSFAALQGDCQTLYFYMASRGLSQYSGGQLAAGPNVARRIADSRHDALVIVSFLSCARSLTLTCVPAGPWQGGCSFPARIGSLRTLARNCGAIRRIVGKCAKRRIQETEL